jgi:hypothetical protein
MSALCQQQTYAPQQSIAIFLQQLMPIRWILPVVLCACAVSGQTVAELAIPWMKSRRRIACPLGSGLRRRWDYSKDLRSEEWGSTVILRGNKPQDRMSALRCAAQVIPRICTVKALHLASLTTKVFFGECQNNPSPVFGSRGSCTSVKPHDITRELLLLLGKGIVSIGHT